MNRGSSSLLMTRIKPGGKFGERPQVSDGLRRHGKTPLHFDPDVVGNAAEACPQLVRALEFVSHVTALPFIALGGHAKPSSPLNGLIDLDQMHGCPARKRPTSPRGLDCSLANTSSIGRLPGERRELAKFHVVSKRQGRPYRLLPMAVHDGRFCLFEATVRPVRFDLRQCRLLQKPTIYALGST